MTAIKWDTSGKRLFEAGVSCGVLYVPGYKGVAWNGLTGVSETPSGGDSKPLYMDGYRYYNETSLEEFSGTLTAFTYPDEFSMVDGSNTFGRGVYYEYQDRKEFNLSYRSAIGNDVSGVDHGYKIHLLYNLLASPSQKDRTTISDKVSPLEFSWSLSAKPVIISAKKPTAHIVIDSRSSDPASLKALEDLLYGTPTTNPRFPTPKELIDIFDDWTRLEIIPNTTSGLAKLKYNGRPDLKGDSFIGLYKAPLETRLKEKSPSGLFKLE